MRVLLTTLNSKYIHRNLALRWLYVTRPDSIEADIKEYTINDSLAKITLSMNLECYDAIGISVYIWNASLVKEWIVQIKKLSPKIRIVLGGPEVSFENDAWFDLPIAAIVQGEGEKVFWDFLQGVLPPEVKTKKGLCLNQAKIDLKWLETFENPYFLPFDLPDMNHRYLYFECSRGCPYRCRYCLSSTDPIVRTFSLDYLTALFDRFRQYQIRQVKFLDRTFNVSTKRALAIMEYLNDLPTVSNFHMELVADKLDDRIIQFIEEKMKTERFRFEIGIQSFNQKTLREVGRHSDLQRLQSVITRLKERGVVMHTDLIAGLPYEDCASFKASYNQLFRLNPQEIQVGILKLLKGTAMRANANRYGMRFQDEPTYDVQRTNWLEASDLQRIRLVNLATEKCYNNRKLEHTIHELTALQGMDPFDLMADLGAALDTLQHPYQNRDYFMAIYQVLTGRLEDKILKGLLLVDYYRNSRQRPTRLFSTVQDARIKELVIAEGILNAHIYDHYAVVTDAVCDNRMLYQLIVYNAQQSDALHYFIDLEKGSIKSRI